MSAPLRVVCAGEVMVEMSPLADRPGCYERAFAGDTYNTAVHLARQAPSLDVAYFTRLGDDSLSDAIVRQLSDEGIATDLVQRVAGRQPGLYLIENSPDGERTFRYWRGESPARELFRERVKLRHPDVFFFTGITLAISRTDHAGLLALLGDLLEHDCELVFDPNFRPALWPDLDEARALYRTVLDYCDVVLPTLDDERALWGLSSVADLRDFYQAFEIRELVVKGDELVADVFGEAGHVRRQARSVTAIDTTGAGDSFNAGYLASRLTGGSVEQALASAQTLAAKVVQARGAVPPVE